MAQNRVCNCFFYTRSTTFVVDMIFFLRLGCHTSCKELELSLDIINKQKNIIKKTRTLFADGFQIPPVCQTKVTLKDISNFCFSFLFHESN